MKKLIFVVTLVAAFFTIASAASASEPKYRVAWRTTVTHFSSHGSWTQKDQAFLVAEKRSYSPILQYHVEKRRKLFFVPFPPKRISTNSFNPTTGMYVGDTVEYHLSEWKPGKVRIGKIQGFDGDVLVFIDGEAMGFSCIIKHDRKSN